MRRMDKMECARAGFGSSSSTPDDRGDDDNVDNCEGNSTLSSPEHGARSLPMHYKTKSRSVARSPYRCCYWCQNHAIHLPICGVVAVTVFLTMVSHTPIGRRGHVPSMSSSVEKSSSDPLMLPRPHLDELINDLESDIRRNVSWLMDFGIVGFSKCATTTQMQWLRRHPEILMYNKEIHSLKNGRPAELVSLLYALPNRPGKKRGYKDPSNIRRHEALESLRTYWPGVKLIIGVRHPVRWFESFYNYKARKIDCGKNGTHRFGPAELMNVPEHVEFHLHLSRLGKTNVLDPGEHALLGARVPDQPVTMNNKVFLYEVSQPFDVRDGRDVQYRLDMKEFLGLSSPLEPLRPRTEPSPNKHYAIDICDRKYKYLRHQLVEIGKDAAEWIVKYFIEHPDVTVSSPDHFKELLETWSSDPCNKSRHISRETVSIES